MSKLDGLEAGQTRIEESLGRRLDAHNLIFQQHTEEDKKLAEHILSVEREVTFAKGDLRRQRGDSSDCGPQRMVEALMAFDPLTEGLSFAHAVVHKILPYSDKKN